MRRFADGEDPQYPADQSPRLPAFASSASTRYSRLWAHSGLSASVGLCGNHRARPSLTSWRAVSNQLPSVSWA